MDHSYVVADCIVHNCLSCINAELGSPYDLGEGPQPVLHWRCRCVRIPYIEDRRTERPFVEDERPVSNIPIDERGGKIGRTRLRYREFFERQTEADKKRILGPARYELYQQGTKFNEFENDRTLKILTIDELDAAA